MDVRWAYIDDLLEKQCEQKSAWSEEDEKKLETILYYIKASDYNGKRLSYSDFELTDWLESLKDRVQLQPKQEWSMYDETILKTIIDHFEYKKEFNEAEDYDIVLWLKSLRPHSQWNPSDEQIGVIEAVINNRSFQRRHLDSLYEQLKKLRG